MWVEIAQTSVTKQAGSWEGTSSRFPADGETRHDCGGSSSSVSGLAENGLGVWRINARDLYGSITRWHGMCTIQGLSLFHCTNRDAVPHLVHHKFQGLRWG